MVGAGIIIMGGSTKQWRSWNFHGNSNAAVEHAARYVLENWPESLPMAYAVDTRKAYEEMPHQILNPKVYYSIKMPYIVNWTVMVGGH